MSTPAHLWILGSPDPEMEAVEALLRNAGERVAHATVNGKRVRPETAYWGTAHRYATECGPAEDQETWVLVECQVPVPDGCTVVRVDHHRPGDPGYGRPPGEFLAASSVGQVIAHLASLNQVPGWPRLGRTGDNPSDLYWSPLGWVITEVHHRLIPTDYAVIAAADHCLAAAYRGECPGVDPGALMAWRVASRAAFQRRDPAALLADVEATRLALRSAPVVDIGSLPIGCDYHGPTHPDPVSCPACGLSPAVLVRDMRRAQPWPELPEAAAREGAAYIAGPLRGPDGRVKITCVGEAHVIDAFLAWVREGTVADVRVDPTSGYGDPARGFAGAYLQGT